MRHVWLILAIFILWKAGERVDEVTTISRIERDSVEELTNSLRRLERAYEKLGVKFPIVPIAQSSIETDWWTSNIWKENKNGYGMKYNTRGHAVGINRGHAKYETSAQSLLDYRDWQRKCLKLRPDIDTEEEYISMLDSLPICKGCRYAEDPFYTTKVRMRINLIRDLMGD